MKNTLFSLIFSLFASFFLISCEDNIGDISPDNFPEGQIWATIDGELFQFDSPGRLNPQDANSYAPANQFSTMSRETTTGFFGSAQLRIFRIDLDQTSYPIDLAEECAFTFRPQPNTAFTGRDGEIQVRLTGFEDDVLQGTFTGTVRNEDAPSQTFLVRNGQFKIRLTRF